MKKTLVTVLSTLAIAFAAIGVAAWGNGKTEVQPVVAEDTGATYKTAVEYGLEDLLLNTSGTHYANLLLNSDFFTADGEEFYNTVTFRNYLVDTTITENSSVSIKFDLKSKKATGDSNGQLNFQVGDSVFRVRPNSISNQIIVIDSVTGGSKQIQKSMRIDEWHTYEFIKQYKTDGSETFLATVKIDGVVIHNAEYTGSATDGILQISYLKNNDILLRSSNYAGQTMWNLETPKMVDIAENNPEFVMKTTRTTAININISKYVDGADNSLFGQYGTSSVGISFRILNKGTEWASKEGFMIRFHDDIMIGLRRRGHDNSATTKATLNFYFNTTPGNGVSWSNAYQLKMQTEHEKNWTAEHSYEIIRQKNNGTAGGWVMTVKQDGVVIVRHWIKTQACTNDRIICYATNNCESIIRSATHYGVNAIVDGEDNITAVANGESYNIPAYNGDKMFFGWVNGGAIMTNTTVTEETTVEALVLGATNTAGVSLRWLHAGEASLKWTVTFDKSDYDALVAFFGEEKVALGYEITTTSDTSKKITKTGDAIDTVVNGDEISFSVLLSHITEDHYDWAFNTRTFVVVDGAEYSVEDNNNTTSLKALAQAEYDLVSDVETAEFKYEIIEGDDEGKFSKYSTAQRRVLEGYIA